MAAISCKKHHPHADVLLLERNDRIGVKLRLTGGGRCNVTADVSDAQIIKHTPKNGRFLYSSLSQFNTKDIQNFFVQRGCSLKIEDHQRVFPSSDKATDIVDVLESELKKNKIDIHLNELVKAVDIDQKRIITDQKTYAFDHVIIATGGISYPQTGSDGVGFDLIRMTGHHITDLKPAEVPLVSNESIIQSKQLQGLSFKDIALTAYVDDKKIIRVEHDLIITHFGLSGPAALSVSSYLTNAFDKSEHVFVMIDFLPKISFTELRKWIENESCEIVLKRLGLPKRLIQMICKDSQPEMIASKVKQFSLTLHGMRGFSLAFVTSGGVDIIDIDPKTMRSKLSPCLSICGEALDVNALTGGYNMTIAFSSGFTAGKHAFLLKDV